MGTKTISRPRGTFKATLDHQKVVDAITEQDEVFLEFVKAQTGFSIAYSNQLMAEIALMTGKYVPEITWVCTKCQEVSRIPLRETLRIRTMGSTTVKCCECGNIVTIKAIDTIVTWKLIRA